MKTTPDGVSWSQPWGTSLHCWEPPRALAGSRDSSIISVDDHTQYTTNELMQQDDSSWDHSASSSGNDIIPLNDPLSDVEMYSSNERQEQHTKDSSPDSNSEGSNHPSRDSDQESEHDQGSGHNSDSSFNHSSHPRSNLGSNSGSDNESESSLSSRNDDQVGDFSNMFNCKGSSSVGTPKKCQCSP